MNKPMRRLVSSAVTSTLITAALTTITVAASPSTAQAAAVGTGARCADNSSVAGSISRCEILGRAQFWVDNGVPYSSGATAADPENKYYTEDCAGLVSMAWHLASSHQVSYPMAGSLYGGPGGTVADGYGTAITKDQLQPGDAILFIDHHTVIFDGWTDTSETSYYAYEESSAPDLTHHNGVTSGWGAIPWPYYVGTTPASATVVPYRYKNVNDAPPVAPSVSKPGSIANGSTVHGTVTVTGTSSLPASNFYVHLQQGGVDKFVSHPAIAGGTSFSYQLDTTQVPNGTYQAVNGGMIGGQGYYSDPITITVANTPAVPTVPAPGRVQGTVTLTASAAGATSISYYVDNVLVGSSPNGSPNFPWNSGLISDGPHQLTATASNSGGTSAKSSPVTIDVENKATTSTVVDANGNLETFSRGADGHLYQSYLNANGWNVYDLTAAGKAPTIVGSPSAVVDSAKNLEIFTHGTDNHLYQTYLNASGWSEYDLTNAGPAPAMAGDPVAMVDSKGILQVYYRDANSHLQQTYLTGTWNQLDLTGSGKAPTIIGNPSAVVDAAKNLEVFTHGTDNHLYQTYLNANGWNEYDLTNAGPAPTMAGDPSAVVDNSGILQVYYRDANGHLQQTYLNGTWNQLDLTGSGKSPTIIGNPSAVVDAAKNLEVFTHGTDNHLYQTYLNANGWNEYDLTNAGPAPALGGSPSAMVDNKGILQIYFRDANGHLQQTYLNGTWNELDLTGSGKAPAL